jgi:hypothetical protein
MRLSSGSRGGRNSRLRESYVGKELGMAVTIQRVVEAFGCHLMSPHLAHGKVTVLDVILDVVLVDINVLCTLVMAVSGEEPD